MLPLLATRALAWAPADLRPVELDRAFAVSPDWDGGPAWFVGGEEGLVALDPAGDELGRSTALHPRQLLVRDLDAAGEPEILSCGPEGIALVRGHRGALALPRPLSDVPCAGLVAFDLDRYPALASVVEGRLTTWVPTPQGLVRTDTGVPAAPGGPIAASGRRVAVVDPAGGLRLTEPAEELPGPVVALAPVEGGFAWVVGGEAPALHRTGAEPVPLDAAVTGLAVGGGELFLLDGPGRRLRPLAGEAWTELPLEPARAEVLDTNADGCPDLLVGAATGEGVLVTGRCGAEPEVASAPPPEPEPVAEAPGLAPAPDYGVDPGRLHRAPPQLEVGGPWSVLDVRVGESLGTRLTWGGRTRRWRSRGGPPGFTVLEDGTVDYVATDEEDVGRWRVAVRATGSGVGPRWTGFEVHVWPADTPMDGELVPARALPGSGDVVRRPLLPGVQAWLGMGVAAGLAQTNGSGWEHVGESPVQGGVSPMGALTFSAGSKTLSAWIAADSAPFVVYAASPDDRAHAFAVALGADTGSEDLRIGPYGTYGYSVRGLGLRLLATPFTDFRDHPTGFEVRALWLAPQLGAEGSLCWVWQL